MNKTNKKFKKLDKQIYRLLDKQFGLKRYVFLGDMTDGVLTVVITGKERPEKR